ncbi:acyl carrier protein [Streptomyces sp. NPDC097619]|uniref:acyl carrier protein n=1 Tax=Streptomyces sp. NPDC097619 TaxID=3157228 RepID=UPI00332ECFDD
MTTTPGITVAGDLSAWLLDRLALYLERPADTIDPDTPLAAYGMDSVCALSLAGDLEDEHALIVPSTLVFDYPTVADLLTYLNPLLHR